LKSKANTGGRQTSGGLRSFDALTQNAQGLWIAFGRCRGGAFGKIQREQHGHVHRFQTRGHPISFTPAIDDHLDVEFFREVEHAINFAFAIGLHDDRHASGDDRLERFQGFILRRPFHTARITFIDVVHFAITTRVEQHLPHR
jgi:hypothetical protein